MLLILNSEWGCIKHITEKKECVLVCFFVVSVYSFYQFGERERKEKSSFNKYRYCKWSCTAMQIYVHLMEGQFGEDMLPQNLKVDLYKNPLQEKGTNSCQLNQFFVPNAISKWTKFEKFRQKNGLICIPTPKLYIWAKSESPHRQNYILKSLCPWGDSLWLK